MTYTHAISLTTLAMFAFAGNSILGRLALNTSMSGRGLWLAEAFTMRRLLASIAILGGLVLVIREK